LELELRELAFAAEVFFIRREDQNGEPETREGTVVLLVLTSLDKVLFIL